MDSYEVLHIDRDGYGNPIFYYIRYYNLGLEWKGIDMKLDSYDFYNFIENKREV